MLHSLIKFAEVQIQQSEIKNLPTTPLGSDTFQRVLQLVFGIAGGIAIIVITVAGFQYVLSLGNAQSAAKAKNAIIYALIGLVVCIFAFSIVTFVLGEV